MDQAHLSSAQRAIELNAGRQQLLDGLAIGASALCVVHCLVLPVLIVLLPTLAGFLAVPEEFHLALLVFAVPTSAVALASGYRVHHVILPALPAGIGLALLALGVFAAPSESTETVFTVTGAFLLAIGHARNWTMLRKSRLRIGQF